MELWVRSQDRDILMKVDSLLVDKDKKCIFTHDKINSVGMTYTLGRYKTKERALEVLDEIKNQLLDNVIATNEDGYATLLENTCLYEMPKV